jgi:hypothetical protein
MLYPVELWLHSDVDFTLAALVIAVERAGFEPAIQVAPYAGLANRCLQPLGHLSGHHDRRLRRWFRQLFGCQGCDERVEEEEGFEPPVLSHNGFQDRRLKPLGHSSKFGGKSEPEYKDRTSLVKIFPLVAVTYPS